MKKKLVGFVFCILLIISVLPATGFITYDGPYLEITWPPDNYETSLSKIVVTGFASGELPLNEYGYTIEYPDGGIFSEFWSISPSVEYYEFEISINLVEGEDGNLITVYAKDTQNNKGFDSVVVVYNPGGDDTEPPEVYFESPEDGTVTYDSSVYLLAHASDNVGITSCRLLHEYEEGEDDYGWIDVPDVKELILEDEINLYYGWNKFTWICKDGSGNEGEDEVEVTKEEPICDNVPKIFDEIPNSATTFYGIFVGVDSVPGKTDLEGAEVSAQLAYNSCNGRGWNDQNKILLKGDQATVQAIRNAFEDMKSKARAGDEFIFWFSGHGGLVSGSGGDSQDEVNGIEDACINVGGGGYISDDTLYDMVSRFNNSVTITLILDCCFSARMHDGNLDVQHAYRWFPDWELEDPDPYEYRLMDPPHINILSASANDNTGLPEQDDDYVHETQYAWVDDDNDGNIDPGEIKNRAIRYNGVWYHDKDNSGSIEPEERTTANRLNQAHVVWLTPFAKKCLDAMSEKEEPSPCCASYDKTSAADRNKDGITTSLEVFEYAIDQIITNYDGDDDKDGLLNEDEIDGVDNDGDGFTDEDWKPTKPCFFENKAPRKPSNLTGSESGKIGTSYIYSTSTTDEDGDDLFYCFDWGDGTNTGWLGPYISGENCDASHSWEEKGDYFIKVKARDRCYQETDWVTLKVTMPKNKVINIPLFLQRLLQRFPFFEKIINQYYN